MARRVPVELTLDAGQYLREAPKVSGVTHAVLVEMEDLGRQVDETGHDMDKLAAEAALAKKEVDGLGNQSKETAADMALLDRRIAATQRSVKNLGLEFSLTGNSVAGDRLGRQQSFLSKLQALRKEMESPTSGGALSLDGLIRDATNGGKVAGAGFAKNFNDSVAASVQGGASTPGLGPILIGALVGAVALALPAIGAMLAGAVAGGIGTVGLAAGIMSATKDPLVKSAAKEFGDHISAEFFSGGTAFVDPIRESLGILQADFDKLDLGSALAKVAPLVTTIASGFGGMVEKIMPGLNKALDRMGPFADVAARGLADVGDAIGDFLDSVTRSHGSIEGLEALFRLLSATIIGTGNVLNWLSERFHDMVKTSAWAAEALANVRDVVSFGQADTRDMHQFAKDLNNFADHDAPYAAQSAKLLGDGIDHVAERAKVAADRIAELNQKTEDYTQANLDLWQANLDAAEAIRVLSENLIDGKKNWDENTKAGHDNQQQLKNTIEAIEAKRQKDVEAAHGNIDAINAVNQEYDKQLEKILGIAAAAGDAKDKVAALEGTYYMKIIIDYQVLNQQNKAKSVDQALFNLTGERAAGGPVIAGGSYWVGEQGPEMVTFNQNGYVNTAQQSASMAQQWSGGSSSSGGTVRHVVDLQLNGRTIRTLLIGEGTGRNVSTVDLSAAYP